MRFRVSSPVVSQEDKRYRRNTFFLGTAIVVFLILLVMFGFNFLIRFSAFLGDKKDNSNNNIIGDDLPPLAPRVYIPFEATNSAVLNLTGTAETNTLIELVKDEVLMDTINVDEDGDFLFENILLNSGKNLFSAVAVSVDGKRSESSKEIIVTFDDQVPQLAMTNPSEEQLTVDYESFDIRGKVNEAASISVNGRVAVMDSEGNFKVNIQLQPGKNECEIKVKDLAGNELIKKIVINYDF